MTEAIITERFSYIWITAFNILIVLNILKGMLPIQDDQDGIRPRNIKQGRKNSTDIALKREASVKHDSCLHTSEGLSV